MFEMSEGILKKINEVLNANPICEVCGGPAEECGCAEVMEADDDVKEPSGDREEIIINPELDTSRVQETSELPT